MESNSVNGNKTAQAAGILLALLLLVGGGYVAWKYLWGGADPAVQTIAVDPSQQPGRRGGPPPAPRPREGVRRTSSGLIIAWKTPVSIRRSEARGGGAEFVLDAEDSGTWIAPDLAKTAMWARRVADTRNVAKYVGLTAEQRQKINALGPTEFYLPPAEVAKLEPLFQAWMKAQNPSDKATAEKPLVAAVAETGTRLLPEAKAHAQNHAKGLTSIVTAEQLVKAREYLTGGAKKPPMTMPMTRPFPQTRSVSQTKPSTQPVGHAG